MAQAARTRVVVLVVIAVAVAIGVGFTVLKAKPSTAAKVPTMAVEADGFGIVFNPDATPVVDLWEDPQCPACKAFEGASGEYINSLARDGRAKVVFHLLTFIGPESVTAANAAACASDEGKFLEFHKALYDKQPAGENTGAWNEDAMISIGQGVGLNSASFTQCVRDGVYKEWTKSISADGASKNINQTPTLLLNNQQVDRNAYYSPQSLEAILKTLGMK